MKYKQAYLDLATMVVSVKSHYDLHRLQTEANRILRENSSIKVQKKDKIRQA